MTNLQQTVHAVQNTLYGHVKQIALIFETFSLRVAKNMNWRVPTT